MSIGNTLSNAASGMAAASRRAEIAANNIANATTEGYARQRVSTNQRITGGNGAGVSVGPAERMSDPRLSASRRTADAQAGGDAALASTGRALADAVGGPGDPASLMTRVAALENSLRSVAENPESGAFQERAVGAAGDVLRSLGSVSTAVQTQRTNADQDIARGVETVNNALQDVKTLNTEISALQASGRGTAALEQRRADALDVIGEHLPIRTLSRSHGQVAIYTDTGVSLLDGNARTLEFEQTTVVTAEMDRRQGAGPLSGLTVGGISIAPGESSQAVTSGKFAGLFEVRDGTTVAALSELDSIAGDLATRFQATGIAAADGRGLFTDAGAVVGTNPPVGLASRLQLNEAVDPAAGGEAWRLRDGLDATTPGPAANSVFAQSLVDAMSEVRSAGSALSTPRSAAGLAAELGTLFERRAETVEDVAASSNGYRAVLLDAEQSTVGVDIDQELKELILIEQAYAANARVIEVADRLVQRLLEI